MFRSLGYLILTIFGIIIIRMVIGVLFKLFSSSVSADGARQRTQARRPRVPQGGVLQKDPVCGAFVPEQGARQLTAGGETHFFCSDECLKKFRESSNA
ncbi:MAG: hypothetical protein C0504_14315 [Candidatus Solibacter sp.]|nr:hypothetical protein [Candidatus Solibacter sp.]